MEPEARAAFERNLEAVRLFALEPGVSLRAIEQTTGVTRPQLYRLLSKVVERASDGRIKGQRALIPYKHQKQYTRVMAIQPKSGLEYTSASGAMEQLLRKYPKILTWMKKVAAERNTRLRSGEVRAVRKPVKDLHGQWLERCARCGVTPAEWPFTYDLRGKRTFEQRLAQLERSEKDRPAQRPNETRAEVPEEFSKRPTLWPAAIRPFQVVQFDGHKIDARITLRVPDPFGMETIFELHRIWILVVTEVQTKAVLGYCLAYGKEYNEDDFAEALQAAIAPHRPVALSIPGLMVKEGGGFPTKMQPELAYHRWQFLQYDEALCHLSNASLERINVTLGTWTIAGRLGEPNDRSYQERFFGLLETSGFHQLPGSLGSNPQDPIRKLADVGSDLSLILSLDQLEQLAYVLIANRNGEKQSGLGGRTALESMTYLTSRDTYLPQLLPITRRHQLFLLKQHTTRDVSRGKAPPHINFEGARYTSDVLQRHPELKGRTLRIYFMARDIRQVHAFFEDGAELGILTAERQWRTTPHSIRLRKEINRLIALGKLRLKPHEDPIEAYVRLKTQEAKDSKLAAGALAQVRASVNAASADLVHGDSPFDPTTRPAAPGNDVIPRPPHKPPVDAPTEPPTPPRLTKTLYF